MQVYFFVCRTRSMVLEKLLELQSLPDKLQIEHFTWSQSPAPAVGRSVLTLNQWSEMNPCPQLDGTYHFCPYNVLYSEELPQLFTSPYARFTICKRDWWRFGFLLSNDLLTFLAMSITCTYTSSSNIKYFWSAHFRLFFFYHFSLGNTQTKTLLEKPGTEFLKTWCNRRY